MATNALGTTTGADRFFRWSDTPPLLTVLKGPNAAAEVRFNGGAGQLYWMEASEDLDGWISIGTAADGGTGAFLYVDPDSRTLRRRSYRAFSP